MAQQDEPSRQILRLANEIRKLQLSLYAVKALLAMQASGGDWGKVVPFLESLRGLEVELLKVDPELKDSELLLRAMKSWQVGEA